MELLPIYLCKDIKHSKFMATTITVKINDDNFIKIQVGNEYRFVEGTEENLVISVRGEVRKRYPRSYRYGGRKDFYQVVTPKPNASGYLQVNVPIRNTTTLVHRLVAEAFIDNPQGYTEIDHLNRNKLDNSVANLRWVTHSENMRNSTMHKVRSSWENIVAEDLVTGEIYEFSRSRDIVPFSLSRGWGRGWSTAIHRKLENGGGVAYQLYWQVKNKRNTR